MTTTETAPESAIQPKQKFSGKVLKITMAGALIDIGLDIPGVLHVSQIREGKTNKVEDVLKEGQSVDVWVRRVRADRVELTLIQPLGLEWKDIKPEMTVKGTVVRLESYGAFIEIGAEKPGMIHVSELAHGYVKTPADVVKPGDEIEAMVLDVDRRKKQIKLSMKALQEKPEPVVEEKPKHEKKHRNKNKEQEVEVETAQEESKEPELTVFELAWRAAQERQNQKRASGKRIKSSNAEQDEILERTLQKRLPTGG